MLADAVLLLDEGPALASCEDTDAHGGWGRAAEGLGDLDLSRFPKIPRRPGAMRSVWEGGRKMSRDSGPPPAQDGEEEKEEEEEEEGN